MINMEFINLCYNKSMEKSSLETAVLKLLQDIYHRKGEKGNKKHLDNKIVTFKKYGISMLKWHGYPYSFATLIL